jgi:hypothetical protein
VLLRAPCSHPVRLDAAKPLLDAATHIHRAHCTQHRLALAVLRQWLSNRAGNARALCVGTLGMMRLPHYFWATTEFCPTFPMRRVDFAEALFRPVPGIKLTRDHPSVIA